MIILYYITSISPSSGGVGKFLQLLSHDLGKVVDMHVVSCYSNDVLLLENVKIHYIHQSLVRAKQEFIRILNEIKPDVVHVNCSWEPICSYVIFWAKQLQYPVVVTTHGMLEPWVLNKNRWKKSIALWGYLKRAIRKSDFLVATSFEEAENQKVLGYNEKIAVIPHGVIVENIPMKRDWKRHHEIFFLALLRPNKGADLLLDATADLKDKLQGYKVVIGGFGSDEYVACLRHKIKELGVEDMVSMPGMVSDAGKYVFYQQADVFVLPTLHENFGIVVAEALACGTPVITTKGAPWADLVTWNCGWWIERDVESLVYTLNEFLELSEGQLEQMGRNGRRLVEEKYSSRKMAEEMLKLYVRLNGE